MAAYFNPFFSSVFTFSGKFAVARLRRSSWTLLLATLMRPL